MLRALRLARQGVGSTSPNPLVGAVLTRRGAVLGEGYHHRAGLPHAEIEALEDARRRGHSARGATLYVTLEPCSTHGRTPPCTEAILAAGIRRVVVAATDPNPRHAGRGLELLRKAGVQVESGLLREASERMNEGFNHWILHHTPFVTVKAAMTLDGKIATPSGDSKWITGPQARGIGMSLRAAADAILVGVNTLIADNPSLTVRPVAGARPAIHPRPLLRVILDTRARTPLDSRVVTDATAATHTLVVVGGKAPAARIAALRRQVTVWKAPGAPGRIPLGWLLRRLGRLGILSLLVEGGGVVNASFLLERRAHRAAFFYAPKILGGEDSPRGVAGARGARSLQEAISLEGIEWKRVGADLFLTGRIRRKRPERN
ncbi:MAG TPA: bifunctional diaminohydroxyphosphoribosylaminopyrimidine deaminase/5-amino-6-(5-phosphoribosylamino)uracil reductase RibD [Verrucomicrobiales bacterium]|nr:bifunctional diaminohydroxyphosphoribosylaminopyrimidine deaminase/5-amino-6-(5-phosphoribosylamino)uracil reductase RibD [Verrucomicrobiales bacterium]